MRLDAPRGIAALHVSAAADAAPIPGVHYVTFAGAHFKEHHATVAQANYWDNRSAVL
jgi:hypothetical protein